MRKNKILALFISLILVSGLLIGCSSGSQDTQNTTESSQGDSTNEPAQETAKYQDGIYFAQEDGFGETGWKYVVTLEVKDGKIVSADWNGAHKNAGIDKKTSSKEGIYGMVAKGGAKSEWHEQAEKVEAYLLEIQDPKAIKYIDEEGHVDTIAGVSIHVKEFFDLVEKALANGPVGKGKYKDGAYRAEQPEFSEKSGWKGTVDLTVINGYIVAANWNAVHKDGGDDKKTRSINGEYVMKENGVPWHEQAAKVEAYLLETQDPTSMEYMDEEGHIDAISGVSIQVKEFFELAQQALNEAK